MATDISGETEGKRATLSNPLAVSLAGSLVPENYDSVALTYVAAGNGAGKIETVTYKLDGDTIATLTLAYNGDDKLSTVTRS